jgi:hypothetical protein
MSLLSCKNFRISQDVVLLGDVHMLYDLSLLRKISPVIYVFDLTSFDVGCSTLLAQDFPF